MSGEGLAPFSWLALDLETTGLSPTRHRIRELAVVPFSSTLQESGTRIDFPASPARSGLKTRLAGSPFQRILTKVAQHGFFLAHNAAFDLAFLAETLRRHKSGPFELRAYCTLRLAKALLPELQSYELESLRDVLDLGHRPAHEAIQDARAVASLVQLFCVRFELASEDDLAAIHGAPLRVARGTTPRRKENPNGS